jgi:hypothetical protein
MSRRPSTVAGHIPIMPFLGTWEDALDFGQTQRYQVLNNVTSTIGLAGLAKGDRRVKIKKYGPWLGYLTVGLYYGWFVLAASSNGPVEAVSRYVPGWLAMAIWASWLLLIPVGRGPLRIPEYLRVSLAVLFLLTCMLLPIAVRFHLVATLLISGVGCVELFWLIPRWKASRQQQEPR